MIKINKNQVDPKNIQSDKFTAYFPGMGMLSAAATKEAAITYLTTGAGYLISTQDIVVSKNFQIMSNA